MLNTFPWFLTYSFSAPLLVRLALGLTFLYFGYHKLVKEKGHKANFFESLGLKPGKYYVAAFGFIEFFAGLLLVVGLFTQIAAIITAIISLGCLWIKKFKKEVNLDTSSLTFFILLLISLSLILSGAGAMAFDVPL